MNKRDEILESFIEDEDFEAAREYTRLQITSKKIYSMNELIKNYEDLSKGQYTPIIARKKEQSLIPQKQKIHNIQEDSTKQIILDYPSIHRTTPNHRYDVQPPRLILLDNAQLHLERIITSNTFSATLGYMSDSTNKIDFLLIQRDYNEHITPLTNHFTANKNWDLQNNAKYAITGQALPLTYLTEREEILKDTPLIRLYKLEKIDDDFSNKKKKPTQPLVNTI